MNMNSGSYYSSEVRRASPPTEPPHGPLPLPRFRPPTALVRSRVVLDHGSSPRMFVLKIAICLKRVPDTVAKITIAADRKSIDESGLKFVPNPYDEFAIEEAIALKEKAGSGETVVYGIGTDAAQETLRAALAMGIDRAVLLQSPGSPDGLEIARVLA